MQLGTLAISHLAISRQENTSSLAGGRTSFAETWGVANDQEPRAKDFFCGWLSSSATTCFSCSTDFADFAVSRFRSSVRALLFLTADG
jgi:hypothetical protein